MPRRAIERLAFWVAVSSMTVACARGDDDAPASATNDASADARDGGGARDGVVADEGGEVALDMPEASIAFDAVTLAEASVSIEPGGSQLVHVGLTGPASSGFTVYFALFGAPSGVTPTVLPDAVTFVGDDADVATLNVPVAAATKPGTYSITLRATAGAIVHTASLQVVVTPPP